MKDVKYLSGKGKDSLKSIKFSDGSTASAPLFTEEFRKNYAEDLKEQIIRKNKLNREWAKDHLEVIM